MKNSFGNNFTVTIAGESHGDGITVIIDGVIPGVKIDREVIEHALYLRRPSGEVSTKRQEADDFKILSGIFEGYTTGTPIAIFIPNTNTKSKDYSATRPFPRPGHADYSGHVKYMGFEDYRGGGHFSGRITSGIVAAGAIAGEILKKYGIKCGTHVQSCGGVYDRFLNENDYNSDIDILNKLNFPVLDEEAKDAMKKVIKTASENRDSVGGITETVITGLEAGVGEPWFDSVESMISHAVFSVPGIKGIEFGAGFSFAGMTGSKANDPFFMDGDKIKTKTNNNGGINGGITNGMPILFRCAVKPTPSIYKEQQTVNMLTGEDAAIEIVGRHDPAIIHRASIVITSVTNIAILDLLTTRFGYCNRLGDKSC